MFLCRYITISFNANFDYYGVLFGFSISLFLYWNISIHIVSKYFYVYVWVYGYTIFNNSLNRI